MPHPRRPLLRAAPSGAALAGVQVAGLDTVHVPVAASASLLPVTVLDSKGAGAIPAAVALPLEGSTLRIAAAAAGHATAAAGSGWHRRRVGRVEAEARRVAGSPMRLREALLGPAAADLVVLVVGGGLHIQELLLISEAETGIWSGARPISAPGGGGGRGASLGTAGGCMVASAPEGSIRPVPVALPAALAPLLACEEGAYVCGTAVLNCGGSGRSCGSPFGGGAPAGGCSLLLAVLPQIRCPGEVLEAGHVIQRVMPLWRCQAIVMPDERAPVLVCRCPPARQDSLPGGLCCTLLHA